MHLAENRGDSGWTNVNCYYVCWLSSPSHLLRWDVTITLISVRELDNTMLAIADRPALPLATMEQV